MRMLLSVRARPTRGTAVLVAVLVVALHACERASDGRELDIDALPRLAIEAEARIGSVDDPDIGFSRPFGVDVDRDGRVYVLETSDMQIRVYSPNGRVLRRIGGRGGGPGEFQGAPRFGVVGDTLWAYDSQARRITLFDRSGAVLSTGRIADVLVPIPYGFGHIMPWAMREDGTFTSEFMQVAYNRPDDPPTGVEQGDSMPVPRVRFAATGAVVDTIGREASPPPRMVPPPGSSDNRYQSITVGESRHRVPPPPTELAQWIPLHDGRIIIEQPYATTADYGVFNVTRLALSRDTVYSRRFHYTPRAYSSTELDSIAARAARGGNAFINGQPVLTPPAEVDAVRRALRAAMTFPEFKLPIEYARLIDDDERLWLKRREENQPTAHWILLDRNGMPLGEIELPRRARVLWSRGDEFWAVGPDEMEVPWLTRYQVINLLEVQP